MASAWQRGRPALVRMPLSQASTIRSEPGCSTDGSCDKLAVVAPRTREGTGPSPVQRRLIGRQLKRMRDELGITQAAAAAMLGPRGKSRDTIIRVEQGETAIARDDLTALLAGYGAEPEMRQVLWDLYEASPTRMWTPASPSAAFVLGIGLEAIATKFQTVNTMTIPGYLQTTEYARAVMHALSIDPDPAVIDQQAEMRNQRHRRLLEDQAPTVVALIDEAALRRSMKLGLHKMTAQVDRLLEPPPSVELRVIPLDAGPHACLTTFSIFEFGSGLLEPVVYVDDVGSGTVVFDDDEEVDTFKTTFAQTVEVALGKEGTAELIRQIISRK